MLKKFDRYIIKQYLSTFFFTVLMITMVSIAIDFFEKVDKFLNDELTTMQILEEYYLHFIPWINGLLWPLFALISVIFFTSRLARNTEIIAVLSSGVSYNRILRPYIISASILSILLWTGNNYIIPNSSRIKFEFESKYIKKSNKKTLSNDVHFYISPNEKVYFRMFSSRDSSARSFRLERFEGTKLTYVLKTKKLSWNSTTSKWKMNNYEERFFDKSGEQLIIKKDIERDTLFPFLPDDFIRYSNQMEMMTTSELKKFIDEEQSKGINTANKYLLELYRRTSDPFTILILTIMGVSIASKKVRGGMGLHLALGIVLGAGYVILSKFAVTFVTNMNFSPLVGIWIPNIVFSIIAFYLYLNAQK